MNMTRPMVVAAMSGLLALTGCGKDEDSNQDPNEQSSKLTYNEYIAKYERAQCEREQRCEDSPAATSVEECLESIAPGLKRARERTSASIASGKTAYDAEVAEQCLGKIEGSCELTQVDILAFCNEVIAGTLGIGQDCVAHFECEDPDGTRSNGPWCFEECTGLTGQEDQAGQGSCVAASPVNTPACQ